VVTPSTTNSKALTRRKDKKVLLKRKVAIREETAMKA